MRRILWWLRRDLRLTDNVTLYHALNDGAAVIPVFVLDPKLVNSEKIAEARKQFLFESLAALDGTLRKRGSYLVLRQGDAARELVKLAGETQADAVYFHADYTPYARKRDANVVAALERAGIRYEAFNDIYLADPNQVVKKDGSAYTVYTPYRRRFGSMVAIPNRYGTNKKLHTPPGIALRSLERLNATYKTHFLRGGEERGRTLAKEFFTRKNGLGAYGETRNEMAEDATSHLSPHLHFGTVSVRELVRMVRERDLTPGAGDLTPNLPRQARDRLSPSQGEGSKNAQVWVDELVWREFYSQVMYHFPHAARGAFRAQYANLAWDDDDELFEAWCEGRTGYPIVDAGMRQLNALGWMHNRARMITASFLTKDLIVNWQRGEGYFMRQLVDGDVASNNGGWQWAAGTGTDAQPYFRIFNPVRQGERFDATGAYVRRWVPELEQVPSRYIHAPWEMPADTARTIGFSLGRDYPKPIVEHAAQREVALALYRG